MRHTIHSTLACTYSCRLAVWGVLVAGSLCAVLIPLCRLADPSSPQRQQKSNRSSLYCGHWEPALDSNELVSPSDDPECFYGISGSNGFCKEDAMWTKRRTYLENDFDSAPGNESRMITTDCRFVSIDFTYYKAELQCFTAFWGSYSKPPSYTRLNLNTSYNLVVEYNAHTSSVFSDGHMAAVVTVPLPLGDGKQGDSMEHGTPAMYPETNISWSLIFTAYTNYTENQTEVTELVPYVVSLTLQNIPMYQMYNTNCKWYAAGKALKITGKVALDGMSLEMLRIMQFVMWILAAAAFSATVWWVLQPPCAESEMRYDLLAFCAALLFALPAMRGLWPAAPPGGTVADVKHIYPQLLLISFAILLQLGKFLHEECTLRSRRGGTGAPANTSFTGGLQSPPAPPALSNTVCTDTRGLPAASACSSSAVRLTVASWPLDQQSAVAKELQNVRRLTWSASP